MSDDEELTCGDPHCVFTKTHLHYSGDGKFDPKLIAYGGKLVSDDYSVPKTRLHFALVVLGYSLAMVALGALLGVLVGAVLRWMGVT